MKKFFAGLGVLTAVVVTLPMIAAFEAHVVNVTATIENALSVPVESLDFGTVFPQEKLDKTFDVSLSGSFIEADRMDDVEYFVRQKPKCGLPVPETDPVEYSAFGQVTEDAEGNFICKDEGYVMLPLLCPYLSKHELTADGTEQENDGAGIAAFHGPITHAEWTLAVAKQFDVTGRLVKLGQDTSDTWNIDLKVPCFGGHCAQDWEDFVHGVNPDADPAAYIQPLEDEHQLYGCDLWLEVSGLSCASTPSNGQVLSDTSNTVVENGNANAEGLTFIHPAWTASIPGATWIWENDPVENPTTNETFTFEKQFVVVGTVTSATLQIATDNTYRAYVNNVLVGQEVVTLNNFQLATQDAYAVVNLVPGVNTVKIEVTNSGVPGSTPAGNPAGLLYKLVYEATSCAVVQ